MSCAADSPPPPPPPPAVATDSARLLPPDPLFVSERVAEGSLAVDAFLLLLLLLPEVFWAPRPAEEDWPDEATPPRAEWDSDSDGRGPLSRKGLPVA